MGRSWDGDRLCWGLSQDWTNHACCVDHRNGAYVLGMLF